MLGLWESNQHLTNLVYPSDWISVPDDIGGLKIGRGKTLGEVDKGGGVSPREASGWLPTVVQWHVVPSTGKAIFMHHLTNPSISVHQLVVIFDKLVADVNHMQ